MSKLSKFEIVMYVIQAAIVVAGVALMIFGSPGAGAQVTQQGLGTSGAAAAPKPVPPAAAVPKVAPPPAATPPAPAAAAPTPPPPAPVIKTPPAPAVAAPKPAAPAPVTKAPPAPAPAAPKPAAPAPASAAVDPASAPVPRELGLTDGAEYFRGRKIRASLTVAQNVSGLAATAGQGAELYTKNERLKQEEQAQQEVEAGTPGSSGSGDSYSYRSFVESDRSV